MNPELFHYRAIVSKVYDGDTITTDIDLGLNLWARKVKLRLYGIDTPEVRGPEREDGLVARDWLREQILDKEVVIKTYKDKKGKYGRLLAEVWIDDRNINQELIERGLAEPYPD